MIPAAILIRFTGIKWIDHLISILIGIIIFISAFRVLRSALHILLEGVTEGLSIPQINERMNSIQAVKAVHDLHVWNLCSDQISLSAHIVLQDDRESETIVIMNELRRVLREEFHIQHTTIQFENTPCPEGCGRCN